MALLKTNFMGNPHFYLFTYTCVFYPSFVLLSSCEEIVLMQIGFASFGSC